MRNSVLSRVFWWSLRALPLIIYIAMLFQAKYVPAESSFVNYNSAPNLISAFSVLYLDTMPDLGISSIFQEYFHIPQFKAFGLYGAYLVYIEILKLIVTLLTFIPKWANNMAERWSL